MVLKLKGIIIYVKGIQPIIYLANYLTACKNLVGFNGIQKVKGRKKAILENVGQHLEAL
jgi:hypothetical protein